MNCQCKSTVVLVEQDRSSARRGSGSQRNLSRRADWIAARAAHPPLPGDLPATAIDQPLDNRTDGRHAPVAVNLNFVIRPAADDNLVARRPAESPKGDLLQWYVAQSTTTCWRETLIDNRQRIGPGN
jgi:hypothetical protein